MGVEALVVVMLVVIAAVGMASSIGPWRHFVAVVREEMQGQSVPSSEQVEGRDEVKLDFGLTHGDLGRGAGVTSSCVRLCRELRRRHPSRACPNMPMSTLYAIVPAAGRGSRLHPLTLERPKPLLEVAGRPILEHVLRHLAPFEPTEVVLVVGWRGDAILDRFGERWEGIPLSYVRQEEPLGLAHALALGAEGRAGPFLVMHGDVIYGPEVELAPVVEAFRRSDVAAALLTERREPSAVQRGAVQVGEDGRVMALSEYPGEEERRWGRVAAGFYAFGEVVKEALRAVSPSHAGEYEVPDALAWLLARGHQVRAYDMEGERVNVNAPDDLVRAEGLLAS